jgi:DNA-binding MarR family transcriptional regulator
VARPIDVLIAPNATVWAKIPGTDRRVKTVVLTPLGAKTRAAVIERLHEPPDDLLALDREDLEELRAALAKLPKSELPFGA